MIYAPGQTWDASLPPKPRFWMDQLNGLPSERRLNADTFSTQVQRALAAKGSESTPQRGL
jgi:hypothetical protein